MLSPLAGKPAPSSILIDVQKLIAAYYEERPDPSIARQKVIFGTSGHRGSAFDKTFNENHILAISQAICMYRQQSKIKGPLFMGMDTHALSMPALQTALEVFAANDIDVMLAKNNEYTPTPVISHAILDYNLHHTMALSDGVVITPSHDPPRDGGFKYNSPNGGPADLKITNWIEQKANDFLENQLRGVKRIPFEKAFRSSTTHQHDYLNNYVNDLANVIDMDIIRGSHIHMGVDPLGGAGVHYWPVIAERYGINLKSVNNAVDPTFKFMTVDWDGQIRMDPSSPYAMQGFIQLKDHFDIAFACDTDHDRHGIVSKNKGLLAPNQYLTLAIFYLLKNRPLWDKKTTIGKTVVSSQMIDRVVKQLNCTLYEVPVGFKWFVEKLSNHSMAFCGEESAGATFSRINGDLWTTDKDGISLALLSAEISARLEKDIGDIYAQIDQMIGKSFYKRIDAKASTTEKNWLKTLSPEDIHHMELVGEKIDSIITMAPGNNAPIGGLKVITKKAWFAARPSGTEDIYRIYAESFETSTHLDEVLTEAKSIIQQAFTEKKHE